MVEYVVVVYALSFNYVCMCACDVGRKNTHALGSFEVEIVVLKLVLWEAMEFQGFVSSL